MHCSRQGGRKKGSAGGAEASLAGSWLRQGSLPSRVQVQLLQTRLPARLVPGPCALLPKAPPLTPRLSLARVQAESSSRLAFESPPSSPPLPDRWSVQQSRPRAWASPTVHVTACPCRPAHRCIFCTSEEWTSGPQAWLGSSIPGDGGSGGALVGRQHGDEEGGGWGCGLSLEPLTEPLSPLLAGRRCPPPGTLDDALLLPCN